MRRGAAPLESLVRLLRSKKSGKNCRCLLADCGFRNAEVAGSYPAGSIGSRAGFGRPVLQGTCPGRLILTRRGDRLANRFEHGKNRSMPVSSPIRTEFCTIEEAARIIGVHRSQITRYIQNRLLECERVGNQLFLNKKQVRNFVRPRPGNPNFTKFQESC